MIDTVLIQTLSVVFKGASKTWSISSLFDRRIRQACPLSSSSLIFVDLPSVREMRPLAQFNITHQKNTFAVYDIHNYTGKWREKRTERGRERECMHSQCKNERCNEIDSHSCYFFIIRR